MRALKAIGAARKKRGEGGSERNARAYICIATARATRIDQSFANYARDFFLSGDRSAIDLEFSGARVRVPAALSFSVRF